MAVRVCIFLTFVFLQTVSCGVSSISFISEEQIKDIGENVSLKCTVQDAQDYPVLWIKMHKENAVDQLPLSVGNNLILKDDRFSLNYDAASSTFGLQIKDIKETDAGFYQCQVLVSLNNSSSARVELQVRRAPAITDNSTQTVIVTENQPIELECYASGYPIPSISWRRENNAILPIGGFVHRSNSLQIFSTQKEDRGIYYCIAENGVGSEAKHNVSLKVEFAPIVTTLRPRVGQALQYDMYLECHVEAYPAPQITWLKNNEQLFDSSDYRRSESLMENEYTKATLQIITVEDWQYGEYVCRAANKLGTAETKIEIFETIVPVCPPACD